MAWHGMMTETSRVTSERQDLEGGAIKNRHSQLPDTYIAYALYTRKHKNY